MGVSYAPSLGYPQSRLRCSRRIMYGNLVPIKLGLGVIASKLLWPIVLITPFLLRELDAQFTFPDPTCFVVNNSEQCPFINGLKVLPLAGLYTNEDELEAFLAGQGPKDSDYMETFAAENGCSPNASNTHRYHKSVACYTVGLNITTLDCI